MRNVRRFPALALAVALILSVAGSASGQVGPKLYDRLYLLASDEGFLYWGVDPNDPELAVTKVIANCPGPTLTPGGAVCFGSGTGGTPPATNLDVRFSSGSLLGEPITWNASNPLTYHFEMSVSSTFAPTIALATERGGVPTESSVATETSPGIWEGQMKTGGPLLQGDKIRLRVRVPHNYQANRTSIEIATGGASWIQLPRPVKATGVPDLLRESPDAASPLRFDTPGRHFKFNDANYTIGGPYTGDLSQTRRFDLSIPAKAAIVYAWVEAYDTPFTYDVLRGQSPDYRKVNDTPGLTLLHNDDEVAASTSEANQQQGRGTNALATTSVAAGLLTLRVDPVRRFPNELSALEAVAPQSHPYKAYILAVHGDRTLQSMRWRFETSITEPFVPATFPGGNTCVNPSEPVPTTKEVTTFSVGVDWVTASLNTTKYTLGWNAGGQEFSFCGNLGQGDSVRLVNPAEKVWAFAPTPAKDTVMAGWRDTVFEMVVRYAYRAPA